MLYLTRPLKGIQICTFINHQATPVAAFSTLQDGRELGCLSR